MSKVIVVSYSDGDYDTYFKLYSYSPAIVEMLKENLTEYLQKQGFYLSTIKDWKKCVASENWEWDTPVFVTDDQNHEVEITWENIDKNDSICITDKYNITVWIWKKDIIEAVENFDFDEG